MLWKAELCPTIALSPDSLADVTIETFLVTAHNQIRTSCIPTTRRRRAWIYRAALLRSILLRVIFSLSLTCNRNNINQSQCLANTLPRHPEYTDWCVQLIIIDYNLQWIFGYLCDNEWRELNTEMVYTIKFNDLLVVGCRQKHFARFLCQFLWSHFSMQIWKTDCRCRVINRFPFRKTSKWENQLRILPDG